MYDNSLHMVCSFLFTFLYRFLYDVSTANRLKPQVVDIFREHMECSPTVRYLTIMLCTAEFPLRPPPPEETDCEQNFSADEREVYECTPSEETEKE